ncbi:AL1 [Symbiodinium sp. CCMP2456]|nr:AL1 [Symbiodinium sp. CCMP2456]
MQDRLLSIASGFREESFKEPGDDFAKFLSTLPNKEWIPFGDEAPAPRQGVFGAPSDNVLFYLKPCQMPVCGSLSWRADPHHEKELAFLKKDSQHEVRINKQLSTLWSARELLAFAESRSAEFDIANVITNLHRVAKSADRWQVKRDPRLKDLFRRAVEAVTSHDRASVRDIAKIQWAIGRLQFRDVAVEAGLADAILSRLHQFEPQGLSNIIWSFGFVPPSAHLLQGLLDAFSAKVVESDPQALSNVVWSLARLSCRTPLLHSVSRVAVAKLDAFDPQGLANIAWSFATLQHSDPTLFSGICEAFSFGGAGWEPQNVSNLIWSCARIQFSSEPLLDTAVREATSTIDGWSCQGVANLLWGFAKLASAKADLFDKGAQVVKQKLRRFSPQNSASVVWAFAKLSLLTRDLLDLVASDVTLKQAEFSPQHASSVMWACGTSSHYHAKLLTVLSNKASEMSEFNCQDLSNFAWSCAKLLWADAPLLEALAADVCEKTRSFPAQNLAMTVWSFGCLSFRREPMMVALMGHLPSLLGELGPQGLANVAMGCAKLVFKSRVLEDLAAVAAANMKSFSNQEFSMLLWSMAKLALKDTDFIQESVAETKARRELLNPQDLAVLAWAFAHLEGSESHEILDALAWEMTKNVIDFSPQDLSNISWAYATACLEHAVMMSAISMEALRKMGSFQAQDLSNLCWAFAKLGLTDEGLFDALASAVQERIETLLPQNLSMVAWSFAKLGLLNEDMMAAIAREVLRKIEDLDGQATANLVWSWAVLGLRHSWLLEPLMHRASVLMASLNGLEISNVAWGLSLLGLLGPELRKPWLQRAAGCFLETSASGAAWVDFANVCKEPMEAPMAAEVEGRFRERFLEPVLEILLGLQRAEVSPENFESQATKLGLRNLGPTYSVEALQALGFLDSAPDHGWVREARWQCRSVLREWQIPGVHSIVAYAKWKVLHPSGVECVLPGRVFVSEPTESEEELGTWLKAFAACGRFAERMALLTLLRSMSSTLERQQLADFDGSVKMYLSHVPSLCTLGMLCQLLSRCPRLSVRFAFDDAWRSFCGLPRFDSHP